jgi:hypothetical protein
MLSPQFQAFVIAEKKFYRVKDLKTRANGSIEWLDIQDGNEVRRIEDSRLYLLRHESSAVESKKQTEMQKCRQELEKFAGSREVDPAESLLSVFE